LEELGSNTQSSHCTFYEAHLTSSIIYYSQSLISLELVDSC
jgi:hypothetical protein